MRERARSKEPLLDDRRYRLVIEALTDYAIFMVDPDGLVASWNPGARRFKGYEEAEILGRPISCFYTEEDQRAGTPQKALATAAREGHFECEGWRCRKGGSLFWAHVVIDPIRSESNVILGYAKVTRDLTERKTVGAKLQQSEERFRLLAQGATEYAICMLDLEGYVTSWNAGAERMQGYRPEEIIGAHFSRFYTLEDRERFKPAEALATAKREGRYERETWRVRKDLTYFWANVVLDAVIDDSGAIIGFTTMTRDVTDRREAQLALEKAREALVQAQKMDALGKLTGGVAHDFNNLLGAVLGSLELVRSRLPQDAKILSLIDNAIKGAERGITLTQRMLAFARRQEFKPEPVEIPALVLGMTDLLQRCLGPTVLIEARFPLGLASAMADSNQLELALLNLAMNARDAMPNGGTIQIAAHEAVVLDAAKLKPGSYVCVVVTDTGGGMDAATLARALEPFFTTKGVGKGTGLGLPMAHGMAEQSGGGLVLKSRLGEGTTAELWLPIAATPAPGPRAGKVYGPAEGLDKETGALSVLAVDDDQLVLMNTIAMLEELGHAVCTATSGEQALGLMQRQETFDLVITDHLMPRMTGLQLADAIRVDWPRMPIILATGCVEMEPGANFNYAKLAKPFGQRELAMAVGAAFRRA